MTGWFSAQDVNFLRLQTAVFCAECELLSENNTPYCFACGSQAVLSLSRVLGGSLRDQPTARLIADAELDRLVRALLRTMPGTQEQTATENFVPASFASLAPSRHHARAMTSTSSGAGYEFNLHDGQIDLVLLLRHKHVLDRHRTAALPERSGLLLGWIDVGVKVDDHGCPA